MYGKIFEGMFGHPLMEEGLEVRYLWQCMGILADEAGRLDITSSALARRINLPVEAVNDGIALLTRLGRLRPIDDARTDGWLLLAEVPRGRRGFVYLMQQSAAKLFKIGFSINPETRRRQIEAEMGSSVALLARIPTTDMRASERLLHEHFKEVRVASEWFRLSPQMVNSFPRIATRFSTGIDG